MLLKVIVYQMYKLVPTAWGPDPMKCWGPLSPTQHTIRPWICTHWFLKWWWLFVFPVYTEFCLVSTKLRLLLSSDNALVSFGIVNMGQEHGVVVWRFGSPSLKGFFLLLIVPLFHWCLCMLLCFRGSEPVATEAGRVFLNRGKQIYRRI